MKNFPDTFVDYAARLCKEWQSYARGCDPRSEPRRFAKFCKPFLILHPLLGIFSHGSTVFSEANARLPKPLHCAVTLKDRISSEFSDTFAATLGRITVVTIVGGNGWWWYNNFNFFLLGMATTPCCNTKPEAASRRIGLASQPLISNCFQLMVHPTYSVHWSRDCWTQGSYLPSWTRSAGHS